MIPGFIPSLSFPIIQNPGENEYKSTQYVKVLLEPSPDTVANTILESGNGWHLCMYTPQWATTALVEWEFKFDL